MDETLQVTKAAQELLERVPDEAQPILLCEIGSTAHGTGVGTDDFDMMGVFVESPEYVIGTSTLDHVVLSTGDNESINTNEDADLTLYSLRKFARLAAHGNPSILNVFFAPILASTPLGNRIRESAHLFVSQQAKWRYLGYMRQQMERLEGTRGQKRVKRPDLEVKYGFDTKYAYHVLRLGLQGTELLTTGRVSIPIAEPDRTELIGVRTGAMTRAEFMERAAVVENELKELEGCLPERPDWSAIDRFLIETHREAWND
jgi:predicted nucleotidyltransferase